MAVQTTNCHIIRNGRMLLKMANRGVSKGYWNCPGGRIEKGETPEECAMREVREETGLNVHALTKHGRMRFRFADDTPDIVVHLFSATHFSGRTRGSSEGKLRWFSASKIPYGRMWDDDKYWLPLLLKGLKFDADFRFDRNKKISRYVIRSPKEG